MGLLDPTAAQGQPDDSMLGGIFAALRGDPTPSGQPNFFDRMSASPGLNFFSNMAAASGPSLSPSGHDFGSVLTAGTQGMREGAQSSLQMQMARFKMKQMQQYWDMLRQLQSGQGGDQTGANDPSAGPMTQPNIDPTAATMPPTRMGPAPGNALPRAASVVRGLEQNRTQAYDDATGQALAAGDNARGTPTIGYGHTGADVHAGDTIDQAQADALLQRDLQTANGTVRQYVRAPLSQNQEAALTSAAFNLGPRLFVRSDGSPTDLAHALNTGDYHAAADALMNFNTSRGTVNAGLTNRRTQERALFLSPDQPNTMQGSGTFASEGVSPSAQPGPRPSPSGWHLSPDELMAATAGAAGDATGAKLFGDRAYQARDLQNQQQLAQTKSQLDVHAADLTNARELWSTAIPVKYPDGHEELMLKANYLKAIGQPVPPNPFTSPDDHRTAIEQSLTPNGEARAPAVNAPGSLLPQNGSSPPMRPGVGPTPTQSAVQDASGKAIGQDYADAYGSVKAVEQGRTLVQPMQQALDAMANSRLGGTGPLTDSLKSMRNYYQQAASLAGVDPKSKDYQELDKWLSDATLFQKNANKFAFELVRTLGAREAASVVNIGMNSMPNIGMSTESNRNIINYLLGGFKREEDYANWARGWQGDPAQMHSAFLKEHPPEEYASRVHPLPYDPKNRPDLFNNAIYQGPDGKLYRYDLHAPNNRGGTGGLVPAQ